MLNGINNIPYGVGMARTFTTDGKACVRPTASTQQLHDKQVTSSKNGRVRPTASTRRLHDKQVTSSKKELVNMLPREAYEPHHVVNEPRQELDEPHQDIRADSVEVHGYPGGPKDCSILKSYGDHVARQIWEGKVM